MKKKLCLLLALVMLLALFTGCGASAKAETAPSVSAPSAPMTPMEPMAPATGGAYNESYDYKNTVSDSVIYAPESPAEPMPAPESGSGSGNSLPAGVKLIYRANINLESTAFDTAVNTVQALTESCGGYFENSGLDNYSSYRYANYTIRVPAAQFEYFCATIAQMGENGEAFQVRNISRSAEDVSEYYYDTEARLTTQKTKLARLQDLLRQAESMEDIITIESAISETELAIENLTGTLRHYDSLVGYSTINVSINEVYKLTEVEEPVIGFGAKLVAALKTGCTRFVNNAERTLLRIARAWIGWLIFLVIAVVVVIFLVRRVKRAKIARAERKAACTARRTVPAKRDADAPAEDSSER